MYTAKKMMKIQFVMILSVSVPMMKVQTVAGMLTNLPCNITPSGEKDTKIMRSNVVYAFVNM